MNLATEIPNWKSAVTEIKNVLDSNPNLGIKANSFGDIYKGKRGLMVVDVVCSRQRNYDKKVLADLLPEYESNAKDLSLKSLSMSAPTYLKIMKAEPLTMQLIAKKIMDFGLKNSLENEDEICNLWARSDTYWLILEINGIGPVLLEYLRMLCGVDTIKLDVNVGKAIEALGIAIKGYPQNIVLKICNQLAKDVGCTLIELDQALFQLGQSVKKSKIRVERFGWADSTGLKVIKK
jgi:hypothetical protein